MSTQDIRARSYRWIQKCGGNSQLDKCGVMKDSKSFRWASRHVLHTLVCFDRQASCMGSACQYRLLATLSIEPLLKCCYPSSGVSLTM
eukprot:5536199-Amphidinium_carterae.2